MFSMFAPDEDLFSPDARQRALSSGLLGASSAILGRGYSRVPRGPMEGVGAGLSGFQSAFNDAMRQDLQMQELKRRRERDERQDTRADTQLTLSQNADTRAQAQFQAQQDATNRKLAASQKLSAAIKNAQTTGRDILADPDIMGALAELEPTQAITFMQKDNKPSYMAVPESGVIFDQRTGKFITAPGGGGGGKPTDDMRELEVINRQRAAAGQPPMSMEQLYRAKRGQDPSADMDTRSALAEKHGLKPGSPQYQSFVLTGKMPREDQQPLSATDKKAIMEADEGVMAAQNAVASLDRAIALSEQAYEGPTAAARGYVASMFGAPGGEATTNMNNEVMTTALGQMKAIFGGNPTEGERKVLLEIQGSANQPHSVRKEIFGRAKALAERRLQFNKQRADELRGGTFYKPPGAAPANSPAAPSVDYKAKYGLD